MKSEIEYAALVMGLTNNAGMNGDALMIPELVSERGDVDFWPWSPLQDDGDSRRLEIACLNALDRMMDCPASIHDAFKDCEDVRADVSLTPEQYRSAVFALAVAIGKVIDGGGV